MSTYSEQAETHEVNIPSIIPVLPDDLPQVPSLNLSNIKNSSQNDITDAISPCLNKFVYIWLRDGGSFWTYLIYAETKYIAGWRWSGEEWNYFGTRMVNVDYFICD
ncbi:MAG: hypothetical protein AB2421_03795 [Thermotaleaceae bacterium]